MYRVNYGNGQVSSIYASRLEAVREMLEADKSNTYCWLQKYAAGTADEPGEWFTCRSHHDAVT